MCLFTRCLLPIAIAAAVLFHTAPPGGAAWRQKSVAADIFTDEQGTVPKDCSAFSESASEPVGPPEICSPTLPPADKDAQIAVRAFLQDAFCPGQLIKCQILKLAVRIFPETRRFGLPRGGSPWRGIRTHDLSLTESIYRRFIICDDRRCSRLYNKMPFLTRPRESRESWTPEDAGGISLICFDPKHLSLRE